MKSPVHLLVFLMCKQLSLLCLKNVLKKIVRQGVKVEQVAVAAGELHRSRASLAPAEHHEYGIREISGQVVLRGFFAR